MVERRVTDPVRIAQLLASEVEGRTDGPLGQVDVVDANPDAVPEAGGAVAYRLAGPDGVFGTVSLHPHAVVLEIGNEDAEDAEDAGPDAAALRAGAATASATDRDTISVARTGDRLRVEIKSGAAVKPAIDVLRAVGTA